jgi:glutamate-5-semialdehyde dehydrogenase
MIDAPAGRAPAAPGGVRAKAAAARAASAWLARSSAEQRDAALGATTRALTEHRDAIAEANAADLAAAAIEVAAGRLQPSLLQRLKLDAAKLAELIAGLEQLRVLPDPLGRVTLATELDDGLVLRRVTCPLGVVGVIFESRPDALVQIAALCLKSGNAVLLKGGAEAERSNRALAAALSEALAGCGFPPAALTLLASRADVVELLTAREDVDLIVPRGSNALVAAIQQATIIPVLGHAEGICHVVVDAAADLETALAVVVDSKVQYPSACNAVETVLVHADVAARFVPMLCSALGERGVEVRGDETARALGGPAVQAASPADWDSEYGDLVVAVRVVEDLDAALLHIRAHGSRHTEAIVTTDDAAWQRFAAEVDAAGVYRNVSTRFADGARYGFGAEVGIATGKLHPRGPVGLDGLVTYKYLLTGAGHVVADYSGPGAKALRHRPL